MKSVVKETILLCLMILFAVVEIYGSQVKLSPQVYYRFFKYPLVNDFENAGVKVFIQVPYSNLVFIKNEDYYTAEYEIEVLVRGDEESLVLNESFSESFSVIEYNETNSDSMLSFWEHSFKIKPGKYNVELIFKDKNSDNPTKGKVPIEVKKYDENKVCVSDLLFLDRIEFLPNGERKLIPSHKNNVKMNSGKYYAYFEMYSPYEGKEVRIRYGLFDEFSEENQRIREGSMTINKKNKYEFFYTNITDFKLEMGRYILSYEVNQEEESIQVSSEFSVGWEGLPESVENFDEAIEQLRYIASGKEMKEIKNKKGTEKLKAFKEFWEKRDPTPGVGGNEKMTEYYRRVDYAKKYLTNAKGSVAGWLSDRGFIFILMGRPDDIYTQHSNSYGSSYPYSEPHEVWYYYEKRREYFFIDETGFGDYILLSQIYYEDSDMLK